MRNYGLVIGQAGQQSVLLGLQVLTVLVNMKSLWRGYACPTFTTVLMVPCGITPVFSLALLCLPRWPLQAFNSNLKLRGVSFRFLTLAFLL